MRITKLILCVLCVSVALTFFSGCSTPNTANIDLRKKIDQLQIEAADLKRQHDADQATIAGLKSEHSISTLPEDRLGQLFTTHGLKFGRLTGGLDLDSNKPGDEGIKVVVCPIDDQGQALKAAGSFEVDAFDLAAAENNRVGHWTFEVEQTRQSWNGAAMLYTYVLKCPFEKVPAHENLTIRVTFTDALTGRVFTAQRDVQIKRAPVPNS
jgi:hypothetical protein